MLFNATPISQPPVVLTMIEAALPKYEKRKTKQDLEGYSGTGI